MKLKFTRITVVVAGFLMIGGYFLIAEHWAHTLPLLPYLILLACPLLHIFMHGGHGNGHKQTPGEQADHRSEAARSPTKETPKITRVPMTGGRHG